MEKAKLKMDRVTVTLPRDLLEQAVVYLEGEIECNMSRLFRLALRDYLKVTLRKGASPECGRDVRDPR